MALGRLHTLFDLALGGRLNERLRQWRDDGLSYDLIAYELRTTCAGTPVSGETVRGWCRDLGIEKAA